MKTQKLTPEHLDRRAIVYVRQSTAHQVKDNLESQRRQYALKDYARELGFETVTVIDEDLGRSGSGSVTRPGFERLFVELAGHEVGAVFCLEASRLARNGRDWHTLLDVCALVGAVIIDTEGVYDPKDGNDRLLLGLKGTLSEYELTLLRQRALVAIRNKAARGEHRFCLPAGLVWTDDNKIVLNPDQRVQAAIRQVYQKYAELGSMRQVLLWFSQESMQLPIRPNGSQRVDVKWMPPVQNTIKQIITNPLLAGAYAWGRTKARRNNSGTITWEHKPIEKWRVLIVDHHTGYISWKEYLDIQRQLVENTFMRPTGRKAGRGGKALLTGMLRCRRCGKRFCTTYSSDGYNTPRYFCPGQSRQGGQRCISFGGVNVDEAISKEIFCAVEQPAIDAALVAADRVKQQQANRIHALKLELEQARYQAKLAEQRYENIDPNNQLVAPELAKRWNDALHMVDELEKRLAYQVNFVGNQPTVDRNTLLTLARDLPSVWNDHRTNTQTRQRIARILIEEIIADVDLDKGRVILLIHWTGGRHSEVHAKRRRQGQHRLSTSMETIEIIRRMIAYWDEKVIAATLNRLGQKTAKGMTWTSSRVRSVRYRHGITDEVAQAEAKNEPSVSLKEAAKELGTNTMTVRRLIKNKILPADQIVPFAPWRIPVQSLKKPEVDQALRKTSSAVDCPRQETADHQTLMFTDQ